jgi:nucleoside-diphosphate-sugar epimerase/pimeloyl-ACP methyl ester carboxylesterase
VASPGDLDARSILAQPVINKSEQKRLFISGATTFLGSHFLLWQARRSRTCAVLLEGNCKAEAEKQLQRVLAACAASYRSSFAPEEWGDLRRILLGSLSERRCGLDQKLTAELALDQPRYEFWHFPESVDPAPQSNLSFKQELAAVRNALELARSLEAKRFVYISSAYAVGRQPGLVPESLHSLPGEFNNTFEELKCRAEHEIKSYCDSHNIDWRIIRPSSVVGPLCTSTTGGSRGLLYAVTKIFFDLYAERNKDLPALQVAQPETAVNLIPVEHFIADLDYLMDSDFVGGPIYHVTSSYNQTVEALLNSIYRALHLNLSTRCVEAGDAGLQLDVLCDSQWQFYSSYFREGKEFERSLPRKDGITEQELYGYITECLLELRHETEESVFNRVRIVTRDGVALSAFESRNPNDVPVVIINALGMAVAFWLNMTRRLTQSFRVLTWESRGVPDFFATFDPDRCGIKDHVNDLLALLDSRSIRATHLLAWCNGAQVALSFASQFPERTLSLVLLNGAFNSPPNITRSVVEKNMRSIMPRIAKRRKDTELFFRIMNSGRFQKSREGSKEDVPLSSVCSNPALVHLTSAPFKTSELLYRYANVIAQSFNEPEYARAESVIAPTLVISSEDDQITHPNGSREIVNRLQSAELKLVKGDHHSFYDDRMVQDLIYEFLRQSSASLGNS